MIQCRIMIALSFLVPFISSGDNASATSGTGIVATKGQVTHVSSDLPEGVSELVNDKSRTTGWNPWFSEWPNDVNQYAFEIENTDDLNRLIQKLSAIDSDLRQVRLSYQKEPRTLGWVTQLPEGNGIAVIFSIGDQARIDDWYQHVRKPFGLMRFTAAPVAVPPTLTIFVQNRSVKLDELNIPTSIELSMGNVPTVFHKSNTTMEAEQLKTKDESRSDTDLPTEKLDQGSLASQKQIEAFLKSKKSRVKR